jgi:DNA-binding NtrC family response regulator
MQKIKASILILDDNPDILTSLSLYLKHHVERIETAENPSSLSTLLSENRFDAIILDMNFRKGVNDGKEGLYWLNFIKETRPETVVILLTAYGNVEIAVEALKRGGADFLVKPWKNERLLSTLIRALELQESRKEIHRLQSVNEQLNQRISEKELALETLSPKMMQVLKSAERIAHTDAHVLILGENGCGKEVLAHFIHQKSQRKARSFIKVDVGALSSNLFESELFGHTKGAFTDAKENRMGKLEMAHEGTLFLDEIGNLPLLQQAKLLSALQDQTINPVGGNIQIPVDFRLISATNSNLHKLAEDGNFRQDLLFRLNTVELNIPSLRERKEDLKILASQFLKTFTLKYRKPNVDITEAAWHLLHAYHWPGNIRELKHIIERAVILCDTSIEAEHLQLQLKAKPEKMKNTVFPSLKLDEVEKYCIQQAMQKHQGNVSKAARELNINRNTLYRKMEKYDLQ